MIAAALYILQYLTQIRDGDIAISFQKWCAMQCAEQPQFKSWELKLQFNLIVLHLCAQFERGTSQCTFNTCFKLCLGSLHFITRKITTSVIWSTYPIIWWGHYICWPLRWFAHWRALDDLCHTQPLPSHAHPFDYKKPASWEVRMIFHKISGLRCRIQPSQHKKEVHQLLVVLSLVALPPSPHSQNRLIHRAWLC